MTLHVVICLLAFLSTVLAGNLQEDVIEAPVEELECYGSSRGFGYTDSHQFHYDHLRKQYEGCTFVHGNLELTNLDDPDVDYDLSFLRHIRHVTGYVLIGLATEIPVISLPSLQVVRGNGTFGILGHECSFVVVLNYHRTDHTSGLRELHLPQLREISNGKVMFAFNPLLCQVNVGPWAPILRGREDALVLGNQASKCGNCSCEGGCQTPNSDLCGAAPHSECHVTCPYRCFAPGIEGCCSDKCAVGCTGPLDSHCLECKDFKMGGRCLPYCPPQTYYTFQECISFDWPRQRPNP